MQSCGGNSNNPGNDEEFISNEELEDINPTEEPGEEPEPEPEQNPEPEIEITL